MFYHNQIEKQGHPCKKYCSYPILKYLTYDLRAFEIILKIQTEP